MKVQKFLRRHRTIIFWAISLGIVLGAFLFFSYYLLGIGYWDFVPFKERCGGWNAWEGETLCKCSGALVKPGCPPGALCDGGTYYCLFGKCEECYKNVEYCIHLRDDIGSNACREGKIASIPCTRWLELNNQTCFRTANYCSVDSDCLPAQCCHPASCVNKASAPNCEGVFCTMECRLGTLDCGGYCACVNDKCQAVTASA